MRQPQIRILVAESAGFSARAASLLSRLGSVRLANLDYDELRRAIPEYDVVWVRLRNEITADLLSAAYRLQALVTPTTGLSHIDMAAVARFGIRVLSLQGEMQFLKDVRAAAEHTIGLMLSAMRNTAAAVASVRAGEWNAEAFKGTELYGKTAGLIGYGRLGRIVAQYLNAFGCRVLVTDPAVSSVEPGENVVLTPLDRLLNESDIVSLHASLSSLNRQLLSWKEFSSMKAGSWLINTARGELINEDALLHALQTGKLAGAALDVLQGEQSGAALRGKLVRYALERKNLLITPHIGCCTHESMEKVENFLALKAVRELSGVLVPHPPRRGRPPHHLVRAQHA